MLNKLLVRINNINELSYLKEKGINNFLFPLDGFSIGYNTFKIDEIKGLDVNIYLLVNRVFDNDTLNNWNNIILLSYYNSLIKNQFIILFWLFIRYLFL